MRHTARALCTRSKSSRNLFRHITASPSLKGCAWKTLTLTASLVACCPSAVSRHRPPPRPPHRPLGKAMRKSATLDRHYTIM
ncbi:hypothetical protein GCM10027091_50430 [Streptomyces daliensis]